MAAPRYSTRMLNVDLAHGRADGEVLDPVLAISLIGGYGINNRLAYERIPSLADPLSSENSIILGAGPFAGTIVPGAAKLLATTRFPVNGAFATAAGGGSFAMMLKSAGYDHVVVSGVAEKPVYLKIAEDATVICDARHLWGKDAHETVDNLHRAHQPCSVIPIGPAGENLVRNSIASVDKEGTLGRGGLAAVMGSKNLKAIVVLQGSRETAIADPTQLRRLVNEILDRVMRWPGRERLLADGMMPVEDQGVAAIHRQSRRPLACPSCPLADKERIEISGGRYSGMVAHMTHFPIREAYGAQSALERYSLGVKYMDTVNRYGLDLHNLSTLIPLVCSLYEQGIISRQDTGGLELTGGFDATMELLRLMAHNEGFGQVLADGFPGVIARFGRPAEEQAAHVKGHGIVEDPRINGGLGTMEFEQVTAPRGAHVAAGGSPSYARGRPLEDFRRHGQRMGAPDEAIERIVGTTSFNVGRLTRYSEDWYSLFNCLSLCNRAQVNRFYSAASISGLYRAVAGIEAASPDLMRAAERAWTLEKVLNVRAGFSRKDDRAPAAWFRTLKDDQGVEHSMTDYYQTSRITEEDMEGLLDDYYDERGWDVETGIPTPEKLRDLGLGDIALDMAR